MGVFDAQDTILKTTRTLRLRGFDWDGSGGLPLRSDVADTVFILFGEVEILGPELLDNLPNPNIVLGANGTIELAFEDGLTDRQLLLTVECEGVVSYIKVFEDQQTTVEGVIRLDMLNGFSPDEFVELTELFCWLIEE